MSSPLFSACVLNLESGGFYPFFRGTEDECLLRAAKLARLLGTCFHGWKPEADGHTSRFLDQEELQEGDTTLGEPGGESPDFDALVVLEGDPEGPFFSYSDGEAEEDFRDGFRAPADTRFRPGDSLILAQFSPGVPCSWTVASADLGWKEEWHEAQVPLSK
jgi:hypothetical protein